MNEFESTQELLPGNSDANPTRFSRVEFFKKRAIRVITSLPEVVYALNRHWVTIIVCASLGAVACWVKVLVEPLSYQGSMELMLNPSTTFLLEDNQSQKTMKSPAEFQRFLHAQQSLLTCDSVYRKVVVLSGAAEKKPEAQGLSSGLRKRLRENKEPLLQMLGLREKYGKREPTEEERTQFAMERFRKRSFARVDVDSSTIQLSVVGTDRTTILHDLNVWEEAFRAHVEDMERETGQRYVDGRMKYYETLEKEAHKHLLGFKSANPSVTETRLTSLDQEIENLHRRADELRTRLDKELFGEASSTSVGFAVDTEVEAAKALERKWEEGLINALAEGRTESDPKIQELRTKLKLIQKRLNSSAERGPRLDAKSGPALRDYETREAAQRKVESRLRDGIASVASKIDQRASERAILLEKLKVKARHEDEYNQLNEKKRDFGRFNHDTQDLLSHWKTLSIQVSSRPVVDPEPYNIDPLIVILAGCGVGLMLGMGLALLLEIISPRIRFKYDVTEGYSLPVLGVVPER